MLCWMWKLTEKLVTKKLSPATPTLSDSVGMAENRRQDGKQTGGKILDVSITEKNRRVSKKPAKKVKRIASARDTTPTTTTTGVSLSPAGLSTVAGRLLQQRTRWAEPLRTADAPDPISWSGRLPVTSPERQSNANYLNPTAENLRTVKILEWRSCRCTTFMQFSGTETVIELWQWYRCICGPRNWRKLKKRVPSTYISKKMPAECLSRDLSATDSR